MILQGVSLTVENDPEIGEPLDLVAHIDLQEPLDEPETGYMNLGFVNPETGTPQWLGSIPFQIRLDTSYPISSPQYIPAVAGEHVLLLEVHLVGEMLSSSLPVHVPPNKVPGEL